MGTELPLPSDPDRNFRTLVDQLPLIIWTSGADGRNDFLNQHWYAYTGQPPADTAGSVKWGDALHPDDAARTATEWQRVLEVSEAFEIEYRLRRHDGQYRWFLSRAQPQRDAAGHVIKWLGTCTDIHDQKEAQEDFTALANTIPQLVWTTDPVGSHQYFNQRWIDYTGFTVVESLGSEIWNRLLHPDDQARAAEHWAHSLQTGDFYEIEYRFRRHDGEYRWFLGQAAPVRDAQGHITKWFGTCTDIHEQRLSRERLLESESRFRTMADSAPVLIWVAGLDKACTYFNEGWLRFTGRTMAEEVGNGWTEAVHPDDYDRCVQIYSTAFDERQSFQMEYRLRRHDGEYRYLFDTGVPRYRPDGVFAGYIGSCVDIQDVKDAEAAVREREQDLETLANNISQLAWMADPSGHIFWYNQRWYRYTGSNLAEMEGWGWEKVHHPGHIAHVLESWSQALREGTPWEDTFPLRSNTGEFRWFLSRAEPIRDEHGQIVRWFGTNTDVTDQRQLQDQLRSAYDDLETKITFRTLELEREVQRLKNRA